MSVRNPYSVAAVNSNPAPQSSEALTKAEARIKELEDRWERFAKRSQDNEAADRRYAGGRLASIDLQQAQRAMMRSGGSINASEDAFREREHWMAQARRPSAFDSPNPKANEAGGGFADAFRTGW